MQVAQFIRQVHSEVTQRLGAGTLGCPAELVETVLTGYLAGTWGGYELTDEAVEEVLQMAEHQAAGLEPTQTRGVALKPAHMLLRAPAAELLAARAQALVADVVDVARREIMEKALEPVILPLLTAVEAERWIRSEDRSAGWTEDEKAELEELRSVTARIGEIDAGAVARAATLREGIELPLLPIDEANGSLGAYRVALVTSVRGGLPVLAEHTRLIVNAVGVPSPSATLHILTGERLVYASVTMGSTRFTTSLPDGSTVVRREVQFVFRSPDIDQNDMRSMHRLLREQFSAGYTKSLDARDVELALLVWECLEEFSVPPTASFPFKSYGLTTTKLFEIVRQRLEGRGHKEPNWKGLYQRYQRVTDRLDRTITVIGAEKNFNIWRGPASGRGLNAR